MASAPKRRRSSKQLPPELSELMDKLRRDATSFMQQFNTKKPRMREIVEEFLKISEEVKNMQDKTNEVKEAATEAGAALLFEFLEAPFTGSLSLADAAAGVGVAAVVVVGSNVFKMMSENGSAKDVEKLGREFIEIVKPLKETLEEIKTTCEKLEVEAAEAQAGKTLTNMGEFEKILRRVSKLKEMSSGALYASVSLIEVMGGLLALIVSLFRLMATTEEDEKLRRAIIRSADQSKKVTDEFEKTDTHLKKMLE